MDCSLTDGIQYRLVGPRPEAFPLAEAARPSLEDGYVWLMKRAATSSDSFAQGLGAK